MKSGDIISSRYAVQKHIGRGGMQDVYLASDQLLGIEVALKTPQAGQPDKRFIQSAKIAAMVNHHNVAKTLDYFEEEERLFLIEEYVPGEKQNWDDLVLLIHISVRECFIIFRKAWLRPITSV